VGSHPLFSELRRKYGAAYNLGEDVGFADEDRKGYTGPGHWANRDRWRESARGILDAARSVKAMRPDVPRWRSLDVGCGRGVMVEELGAYGLDAFGVDIGADVRSRRCAEANAMALPFAGGAFDVVTALDVVEHVPWDLQPALQRELRRVLAPGGVMFVTVPTKAPRFCLSSDAGIRNHFLTLHPLEWVGMFERFDWRVLGHGDDLTGYGPPFAHGADNYPLALA
jgi:SAM-dependent methyltransferase